jgi:hypothetical protein
MLSRQQCAQFDTDGYLLIPQVLTPAQVREVRAFFRPKFDLPPEQRCSGDAYGDDKIGNYRLYDIYNRYPEVRWLLFHEPVLMILKELLGDDCVEIPECSVALNSFGLNQFGGWHKDTTTMEAAGYRIHYQDDFLMVGLAYYLQDNTPAYGGGLDVQPGTHRQPCDWYLGEVAGPSLAWRAWRKFWRLLGHRLDTTHDGRRSRVVSIPCKAGDVLLFNSRLNHRATLPRHSPIPPDREKIAVFDTFSRNRHYVQAYLDFIHSPAGWGYLPYIALRSDFVQAAHAAGVRLALEGYPRRTMKSVIARPQP